MIEGKPAAFSFEKFQIPSFSYQASGNENLPLGLEFSPAGVYNEKTFKYELTLVVCARENTTNNEVIKVTCKGVFNFTEGTTFESIPDYFYKNSIAILFPYVRSFISTMTLQANCKLLILGLMNLSNLELPLKQATLIHEAEPKKRVGRKSK